MTDRRLVGRALAVAVSLSIAAAWAAGGGAQDASSAPASGGGDGLWSVYDRYLKGAKYIDLTHAFSPVQPVWPGFGNATFAPAKAGKNIEGYVGVGEEFLYGKHGFVASAYVPPISTGPSWTRRHIGTSVAPPSATSRRPSPCGRWS
jgi:hypothetical protein